MQPLAQDVTPEQLLAHWVPQRAFAQLAVCCVKNHARAAV